MPKPPNTPPNSDIDGVDEDERRNTDAANESGQGPAALERARRQGKGRPPYSDEESRDDRAD